METITVKSHDELNALVAEKVMGWKPAERGIFDFRPEPKPIHLKYSTDIAAAWQVVEKMQSNDNFLSIITSKKNKWSVNIWVGKRVSTLVVKHTETTPAAICLAALASVGIDAVLELEATA